MKANNGDVWMATSDGTKYSPSQIGAFVIKNMKEIAGILNCCNWANHLRDLVLRILPNGAN